MIIVGGGVLLPHLPPGENLGRVIAMMMTILHGGREKVKRVIPLDWDLVKLKKKVATVTILPMDMEDMVLLTTPLIIPHLRIKL